MARSGGCGRSARTSRWVDLWKARQRWTGGLIRSDATTTTRGASFHNDCDKSITVEAIRDCARAYETLVTVTLDASGITHLAFWHPHESSQRAGQILTTRSIHTDSTGRWLAALSGSARQERFTLWVGNATAMELIAQEVREAVWHASAPARLAWVEQTYDGMRLMTADFQAGDPEPREVERLDAGQRVVWWTDEGFVIEDTNRGALLLVNEATLIPEAELLNAAFVAAGSAVAAVYKAGTHVLIAPNFDQLSFTPPWSPQCSSIVFSPLKRELVDQQDVPEKIAAVCPVESTVGLGVVIYETTDPATVSLTGPVPVSAAIPPTWADDGRLLIAASYDEVRSRTVLIFVDTETASLDFVTYPGRVLYLEVLKSPDASS